MYVDVSWFWLRRGGEVDREGREEGRDFSPAETWPAEEMQ